VKTTAPFRFPPPARETEAYGVESLSLFPDFVISAKAGTQMRRAEKVQMSSLVLRRTYASQLFVLFTVKHLGPRFRVDDNLLLGRGQS